MVHDDDLVIKNTKLKDLIIWKDKEMADLRERHETTSIRKEKMIADLNEKNEIAQLLIARYKEHAELEDEENSRYNRNRRRDSSQLEELEERRAYCRELRTCKCC